MLGALTVLAAAAAGYVLMRAGWIFLGWPGVAAVVLLLAGLAAWRRLVAAGALLGAVASAVVLSL